MVTVSTDFFPSSIMACSTSARLGLALGQGGDELAHVDRGALVFQCEGAEKGKKVVGEHGPSMDSSASRGRVQVRRRDGRLGNHDRESRKP